MRGCNFLTANDSKFFTLELLLHFDFNYHSPLTSTFVVSSVLLKRTVNLQNTFKTSNPFTNTCFILPLFPTPFLSLFSFDFECCG